MIMRSVFTGLGISGSLAKVNKKSDFQHPYNASAFPQPVHLVLNNYLP